jgi:hypothetical protein
MVNFTIFKALIMEKYIIPRIKHKEFNNINDDEVLGIIIDLVSGV